MKNLVRYAGALGPRSVLRSRVTQAERQKVAYPGLLASWAPATPWEAAAALDRGGTPEG